MIGQSGETCAGEYLSLTYVEAQSACAQIQYNNLKFRVPSRQEYFFAFTTCAANAVTRVRNITSDLNDYDARLVVARNNPATFSMNLDNPSCLIKPNEELSGSNFFPTLKFPLWTSTWAYKLFNDRLCFTNDPSEKCVIVPLSHPDEKEFLDRLETYHSVFEPWKRDFALYMSTAGKEVKRPSHSLGTANSLCVADLPTK